MPEHRRLLTSVRLVIGASAGAFLAACSWLYRFNDPGGSFAFLTDDHFFYLVRAWQILFGDLPVRDFVDHGAPLFYYVGAGVQLVFGRGTLSEIAFCVTVLAACAAGVFLLGVRASGSLLLGLAAAIFHVLLEPRLYNYPKILVYVAAIPALWAFADKPDLVRTALLAGITVVGFLFRHDHGVFVAGAFAVLLLLLPSLPWRARAGRAAVYAALVLALLAPYLAFIQMNGGVTAYFRTATEWAQRDRDRAEVEWPGLFDNPEGVSEEARSGSPAAAAVATVRDNAVAWLYYGELVLPLAALALLALSPGAFRGAWPNASAKLGAVALLAIMLNAGFLRSPLAARLADPSVPQAVLLAWLPVAVARLLWRPADLRPWLRQRVALTRAAQCAAAGLAALLIAVLGFAASHDLERRLERSALADGPREALERAALMWTRIGDAFPLERDAAVDAGDLTAVSLYLRRCTSPTDRVFMQHYLPQVLALGERGFAGGHADLRPGFFTSTEMQQLTVDRLRRQSVPVALVGAGESMGGFRGSFPLVVRYLDQRYEHAGERAFDNRFTIRLLVERGREPAGRFPPLDWPCFQPLER